MNCASDLRRKWKSSCELGCVFVECEKQDVATNYLSKHKYWPLSYKRITKNSFKSTILTVICCMGYSWAGKNKFLASDGTTVTYVTFHSKYY